VKARAALPLDIHADALVREDVDVLPVEIRVANVGLPRPARRDQELGRGVTREAGDGKQSDPWREDLHQQAPARTEADAAS